MIEHPVIARATPPRYCKGHQLWTREVLIVSWAAEAILHLIYADRPFWTHTSHLPRWIPYSARDLEQL